MIVVGLLVIVVGVVIGFVGRWFGRLAQEASASSAEVSREAAGLYRTQRTLLYVVAGAAVVLGLLTLLAGV